MKSQIDLNKYDSEQRCAALISHYENIEDRPKNHRAFWRDLSTFWPTFDNIDHDAIQNLMLNTPYRHAYLTKACQRDLDALFPGEDVLEIYRGQNDHRCGRNYVTGLAWTTAINVAETFARNGIRGVTVGTPYILKAFINKRDIAMAFTERGESEVVLFDMDMSVETLKLAWN